MDPKGIEEAAEAWEEIHFFFEYTHYFIGIIFKKYLKIFFRLFLGADNTDWGVWAPLKI